MTRQLALLLMLAVPASAGRKALSAKEGAANYRVAFSVKAGDLSGAGNFVVSDGSQANYVHGGERPHEVATSNGTSVEFKKVAFITNCVVAAVPDKEEAAAECQFELSGPGKPDPSHKLKVPPIETFQYQTSFTARLGKTLVLVDEPSKRVEVTITRLD
jgi:hypothetical protein